jgi:CRISPR-associated protein Cmr2
VNEKLWQTKLAARLHDPAEKALVLMRDPAGHEGGTSRSLFRLLGYQNLPDDQTSVDADSDQALAKTLFKNGIPNWMYRHVQRADWWAAAADRPQWPMQEITVTTRKGDELTLKVAEWAQVRWSQKPVLIHPLTGDTVDLKTLADTDIEAFKSRAFNHFASLLAGLDAAEESDRDWRKVALAFWRFGPELGVTDSDSADEHELGHLWPLLPADTRVPDHSIWDHLDLTSAFAGAFAADPSGEKAGDVALLSMSLGPVQSFIASARKLDDLWAGSHLLSRLAWETMRPVAEALGPDAILFPRLRGIPQVDLWLRDEMKLPPDWFEHCEWTRRNNDANPLFAAALPNRFVAVVPASQARVLAQRCRDAVHAWIQTLGQECVQALLDVADKNVEPHVPAFAQMREQLAGFPTVHWAAVPFNLIRCRDQARQRDLDPAGLLQAMAPFCGVADGAPCGFLDTPAWQMLSKELTWSDNTTFFAPNPGVLYPAVYDLAERVLAAAKAARTFDALDQQGWRDSLTGEAEWLTTDRAQLNLPPGQRKDTLWTRIAQLRPAWARKGEHLGAAATVKRLWPNLFAKEVAKALGRDQAVDRFVISTHTMALAYPLRNWLASGAPLQFDAVQQLRGRDPVALPRKLVSGSTHRKALEDAKRIPALLDAASESDDADAALKTALQAVRSMLGGDAVRLETYYALLMMDGDQMGSILSGEQATSIAYRDSFHPQVRVGFDLRAQPHPALQAYGAMRRPVSPGRHLSVSAALNDFSQIVARHVVEQEYFGRLIYAGGDDVLAMLPVADLLDCAQRLRHAYSGTQPEDEATDWGALQQDRKGLHLKSGFAFLRGHLMRMMGRHATASTGAVIAHHQAPLPAVMRQLRAAEQRAKQEGGRDAFSLTVVKRSGGALYLTCKWGEPLDLLGDLIDFLRQPKTSRRAVYHSLEWLKDLPDPPAKEADREGCAEMIEQLLAYQLARQSDAGADLTKRIAKRLTKIAMKQREPKPWLANFLSVAEFLAREMRGDAPSKANSDDTPESGHPAQEFAA